MAFLPRWELYVLSMFNNENVMDKVVVAEHAGSGVNLSKVLGLFSLADSHCFDPNEEHKLRQVIAAVGEEKFKEHARLLSDPSYSLGADELAFAGKAKEDGLLAELERRRAAAPAPSACPRVPPTSVLTTPPRETTRMQLFE